MVNLESLHNIEDLRGLADETEEITDENHTIHFEKDGEVLDYDDTIKRVWRGYKSGILREAFEEGYGDTAIEILKGTE